MAEQQSGQSYEEHMADIRRGATAASTFAEKMMAAFEPWMLATSQLEPEVIEKEPPTFLYWVGYPFGRVLGAVAYVWSEILDGVRAGFNDGRW